MSITTYFKKINKKYTVISEYSEISDDFVLELNEVIIYDNSEDIQKIKIGGVVMFCKKVKVNYDTLRAIVFELNHGLTFKEAILDLNILNMKEEKYNLTLLMSDGSKVRRNGCCLDLFSGNKNETTTFDVPKFRYADIIIDYKIKDVKEDPNTGAMIILADDLEYEFRDLEDDEKKEVETTDLKPRMLIIERQMERHLHYMV